MNKILLFMLLIFIGANSFATPSELPITRPVQFDYYARIGDTNSLYIFNGNIVFENPDADSFVGGVIDTDNIINSAITSDKILNDAVTSAKIPDNAIGSSEIASDSVTSDELANNSVTSNEILDGTIGAGELASDSVTSAKILDGTIQSGDIGSEQIVNSHFANGAINGAKIENDTILPAKLVNGALGYLLSSPTYIATHSISDWNVYQNGYNVDQMRIVYCTWRNQNAFAVTVFGKIKDTVGTEHIVASTRNSSADEYINMSFLVPPGWQYKIDGSTPGTMSCQLYKSIGIGLP